MMTTTTEPLRIGILGAAAIAQKNCIAIGLADGCVVTAIASRTREKAEGLASSCVQNPVTIYGGESAYRDLVKSNVCDAIYIPLPTVLHKDWVHKVLRAGKHVLLEKPVAVNVNDFQDMLDTAYLCKRFIMDGTMFVHHNRTHDLVTLVQDEDRVGKADRVEATFSFQGNDDFFKTNIRASAEGDPLGCIGDLGWYCVRLALLVFPTKPISAQVVDYKLNDEGVPINASCFVHFDDNRLLAFHCGFLTPLRQTAVICGSKAIVSLDDFVLPFGAPLHFELHSQSLTQYDLITRDDKVIFEADTGPVQEVLMWQKFAKLAKVVGSVDIASTCCWAGENQEFQEANDLAVTTLVNQSVMHALMQSIASGGSKVNI